MKRSTMLLVFLTGCGLDLTDPRGALITCLQDGDCPTGVCAASGYCVPSRDDSPLRLEVALATSLTTVELRFDDALASVGEVERFIIEPSLTVIAAEPGDDLTTVVLTTAEQAFGAIYEVAASGLTDEQGNPLAVDAARASFVSFLGLPSSAAPRFLSPSLDAVVRTSPVHFAWTAMPGATSYTLEVATDAAFTQELQRFDTSAVTLDVNAPRDVTYHARVRADGTADGLYGTVKFERLNDVIYVFCEADPCLGAGSGSRTAPVQSIALGLTLARVTNSAEVRVAARPGAPYHENITINAAGVRLRGGFAPDFSNDTPDPAVYPTSIRGLNTVVEVIDIPESYGDVLIEALQIIADGPQARGVSIARANAVELIDVTAAAGNTDGTSSSATAVEVRDDRTTPLTRFIMRRSSANANVASQQSAGLDIGGGSFELHESSATGIHAGIKAENFILTGEVDACSFSSSPGTAGRFASIDAQLHVHDSSFLATNTNGSDKGRALQLGQVTAIIERSKLETVTLFPPNSYALELNGTLPIVVRNTMITGRGVLAAVAIRAGVPISQPASPLIVDSTLVAPTSDVIVGLAPNWSVTNSLLYGVTCVREDTLAFAASFVGNGLACPTLYVPYQTPTSVPVTDIGALPALNGSSYCAGSCPTQRRVSGNVQVLGTVSTLFEDFAAVGNADLHLADSAPANLCTSGVDGSAALCGMLSSAAIACGGDGNDLDGQARSTPSCIGVDER